MNNTLILGKKDSGKTTGYMFSKFKSIISAKENLIVIDSKKEYWHTFGKSLKDNGYKTLIINLNEPEKSNGFNILWLPYKLYKEGKKDLSLRILTSLYKEILFNKESHEDSFWINSAANYLIGLTLLLFEQGEEKEINLGSIYVLVMQYERKSFDSLKSYLENLSVTNSIYAYLSGTVLAPIDTRGGITSTVKERLCLYIGSESILKLLCTNEIQLNALDEPYALFIFDNEDYSGITNALIDEVGLYLKNYNLIIDNADNLNKIIRLNTILENSQINNTKLYYISRNKENIRRNYTDSIIDKFNKIIDANLEMLNTIPIGNYDEYPNLVVTKNNYINPDAIKLN